MVEIRLTAAALISFAEAVKVLAVSRMTIYAMIRRGELHPVDVAWHRYLLRAEVERMAKERANDG